MFFQFFFYEFVLVSSCQVAMQVWVMASRHSWRHPLLTMCLFPFDILFLDAFFLILHIFSLFLYLTYCFGILFSWSAILLLFFLDLTYCFWWFSILPDLAHSLSVMHTWIKIKIFGNFIFLGLYRILTWSNWRGQLNTWWYHDGNHS